MVSLKWVLIVWVGAVMATFRQWHTNDLTDEEELFLMDGEKTS
jgi:hypothetical protein